MTILFTVLGVISIAYFIVIVVYSGISTSFCGFWLVAGIVFLLLALEQKFSLVFPKWKNVLLWGRVFTLTTLAAGVVIVAITESLIIGEMVRPAPAGMDYVIVLGAKMSGNQQLPVMEKCMEALLEYQEQNPDTIIIVSGNDTIYDDATQADVMRDWLMERGVDDEHIWMETNANSVQENIRYSLELVHKHDKYNEEPSIGLVTMNFHAFRAQKIAETEGYEVSTIPSKTDFVLLVNEMVREFFAVIKDKLIGNI